MNTGHRTMLVIAGAWIAWLAAQLLLALVLRVEGYDGYWYLSNAWYMAGGQVFHYEVTKAPLVSLLLLPFRLVGIAVDAVFQFLKALLMLPARVLRGPARA